MALCKARFSKTESGIAPSCDYQVQARHEFATVLEVPFNKTNPSNRN